MADFPTYNTPPYTTTPQLPVGQNYSRYLIPVVNEAGLGEAVGRAMAVAGMVTNLGSILGFQTLTDLIVLANGQTFLAEHLYVTLANAQTAGYPNNAGDIQFTDHEAKNSQAA